MFRFLVLFFTVLSVLCLFQPIDAAQKGKKTNVILMIADGAGIATFQASADYQTGSPTGLSYMTKPWKFYGCSTYSIAGEYDPEQMWDSFSAQQTLPTDSAAATTAINTGVKTDEGTIGLDDDQEFLETFAEKASKQGFACGTVTSVQIAHATPAGVAGHVIERKNGHKIFDQILNTGTLTVMMGCGHPEYDKDGKKLSDKTSVRSGSDFYNSSDGTRQPVEFNTFGPSKQAWTKIINGNLPDGWTYIESRTDFQRLASGKGEIPKKLIGLARSHQVLTAGTPRKQIDTCPTLAEESLAALNVLNQNPKGFYLQIEGGYVDTCNHENDLAGMLVEMREFNSAIVAVCDWVEKNSSWDETLVIITSDHETGSLWGPQANKSGTLFQTVQFNGKGVLPTCKYFYGGHTNQLTPVYVRGKDVKQFDKCIQGTDPFFGKLWNFDGRYIDNTDFYQIMTYVMGL